jgi:hypothetical protein
MLICGALWRDSEWWELNKISMLTGFQAMDMCKENSERLEMLRLVACCSVKIL